MRVLGVEGPHRLLETSSSAEDTFQTSQPDSQRARAGVHGMPRWTWTNLWTLLSLPRLFPLSPRWKHFPMLC